MSQIEPMHGTAARTKRVVVGATGRVHKLDFVSPGELQAEPPHVPADVELFGMKVQVAVRGDINGDAAVEIFFWTRPDGSAFTIGNGVFEGEILGSGKGSLPYTLMGEFENAYFSVGVEAVHFETGSEGLQAIDGGMLVSRHQVRDGQPTGSATGWLGMLA